MRNQKCRASDLKSAVGTPVATTTRSARIEPPAVCTSAVLAAERDPSTGDRSKIRRAAIGGRRAKPEARAIRDRASRRRGSRGRTRRRAPTSLLIARARSSDGASSPASRRAFCSRFRRATCSGVVATISAPCGSRSHLMSSRRSSAEKSSAARRHACHACRAASHARAPSRPRRTTRRDRRRSIRPTSRCCRGRCDPASTSTTLTPAAANA